MHGYLLNIILNHSIFITAVVAAIRFKIVYSNYQPFIWLIWLGLINETISLALIYTKGYNTPNSNIYVLLEAMLILYQFCIWETITRLWLVLLIIFCTLVWIADNLIWHSLSSNNSLFRITYSIVITICSIKQIDRLLLSERLFLLKNPVFLICTAFLLYYSCKSFIEVFNAFHLQLSHACNRNIFTIMYVDDFVSNIIYAIAFVCIPRKQLFTMQY